MVEPIYKKSLMVPFIPIEDGFFIGVVANKALNYTIYDLGDKFTDSDDRDNLNDTCLHS